MTVYRDAGFELGAFTHVEFDARSISPEGALVRLRFATQPWAGTTEDVELSIPAGQWTHFQVPFTAFDPPVPDQTFLGIGLSGGGPGAAADDADNSVVLDNIKLVNLSGGSAPPPPAPPTPTSTPAPSAPDASGPTGIEDVRLTVDAGRQVYPFNPNMRGVAMNNWNWLWGGIQDTNSAKRRALIDATSYLAPGVIRFAGGLWVNGTGWDRQNRAPEDGNWTYTDPDDGRQYSYRHAYKPALIDSYAQFAKDLGAETILQVNICDNNPKMWADLVRYANVEKGYDFKYWEFGNELDLDGCVNESQYADRYVAYRNALRQVDPDIRFLGPVPTMPYKTTWYDTLINEIGDDLDVLTWHWYQLTEWTSDRGAFAYQGGSVEALLNYNQGVGNACHDGFGCPGDAIPLSRLNRMTYRRGLPDAMGSEVIARFRRNDADLETAITEIGTHASMHEHPINGNHIAALWLADTMGRWAANGLDIMTYYSLEDGGAGRGNTRGLAGINSDSVLDIRPTYYTEFMYAQYFGDMLVESGTSDPEQNVVVWASTDSDDPNALKLMVVNFNSSAQTAAFDIAGFTPKTGEAYEMTSRDPMSLSDPDSFAGHSTTINGVAIPDYQVNNPSVFRNAVASIKPKTFTASGSFTYEAPAHSVVAITLRSSGGTPPPPAPPTPTPTNTPAPTPTSTPSPTPTPTETPNAAPTANAGPDKTAATGATVSFDGGASTDADGSIASYSWDFGDGSTASGRTASHPYDASGTYRVQLTVTDNDGATASDTALVTVNDTAATVSLPLRINTGGGAVTDRYGNAWQADRAYDPAIGWGYVDADDNSGQIDRSITDPYFTVSGAIHNTVLATERWAMDTYRVDLPDGMYDLRLHFAETYSAIDRTGERVFTVAVEEAEAVPSLDIYAEVGFAKALVKDVYGVQVRDGKLDIQFVSIRQNPLVNGIEVLAALPQGAPNTLVDADLRADVHTDGTVGLLVELGPAMDESTHQPKTDLKVGGFKAQLLFDIADVEIVDVRLLSPLADRTFVVDKENGVVSFAGTDTGGVAPSFPVAFVEIKLKGSALDPTSIHLVVDEATDSAGGRLKPVHHAGNAATLVFQRGDVVADGTVDILDATAGLQYLEGERPVEQVNLINFINVIADGVPDTKDVLALLEYLVGNRDERFEMKGEATV
jgi:hypothetical protein